MASLKEKAARIISAREAQEKPEEVQGSGSAVVNLENDGAAPEAAQEKGDKENRTPCQV